MNKLQQYAELQEKLASVQSEITKLAAEIEGDVSAHGLMSGFGYTAKMKPGRKVVRHEQAANDADVSDELIEKYATTKTTTTVKWAQITKSLNLNLADYTTQGNPSFVIVKDK